METVNRNTIDAAKLPLLAEGASFEMEEVETPEGIFDAFKHAPRNLIEILSAGRAHGDATLFIYEDERWTFNDFFQKVDKVRAWLVNDQGIAVGDRVAIAMRNYPEWLVALTASAFTGAITVPLNSWGMADELKYGLDDCEPKVLFCDPERYALIEPALNEIQATTVVVRVGETKLENNVHDIDTIIAKAGDDFPDIPDVEPDSTSLVLYTSGSTGYPKGVMLTHRAIGQCLMNMYFMGALGIQFANPAMEDKSQYTGCTLITVPLFHGTGLWGSFFVPLQLGQKVILMHKWDADKALRLIEKEAVTTFISVPAIVRSLLLHDDFDQTDTQSLGLFSMAGSATPPDLPPLLHDKLGYVTRATGWGMTETCAIGSSMGYGLYDSHPDAAGIIAPIIKLRTVDSDGGVLPRGEIGEIECFGVTATPGYWRRPDATQEIYRNGWLRTGDVGRIDDDGFVFITGRVKEIVIRGGENIFPGEIEDVAYDHDAVIENIVFGVPDDALGEELAMVYYTAGRELKDGDLRDFLKARLGGFKVPKYIQQSDHPLPQNVSNKLHKKLVRENFISTMRGQY